MLNDPVRVLLVEDNPGDADLTRDVLERSKLSLELDVVVDGVEATDYLLHRGAHVDAKRPHLMILDLNLPRMDGRQVLMEMKKHAELRAIPVIVLTSSDAEKDIVQCYTLGASCYVTKPVDLKAFQSIVTAIEQFWLAVAKLP